MEPVAALHAQILDGALGWLSARVDRFDPFAGGTLARPDPLRTKAALELAMLCMLACEGGLADQRVEACLDALEDAWRRPALHDLLVRSPGRVRLYGMLAVSLRRCGRASDEDLHALRRLVAGGHPCTVEEVPFRAMDLRYMLELAGIPSELPPLSRTFATTVLARSAALGDWSKLDVYAATHALFYVTDFGRAPDLAARPEIVDRVGLLLGIMALDSDWDLTGELLLSCDCLHARPFTYRPALEAFAAAQRGDGCIPATPDSAGPLAPQDDFDRNNHTTLVGALLVSAARRAERSWDHAHAAHV